MNESELVLNCLKGKRDSQKQLYERYAPKMFAVCYRYADSREDAEDFLQEAFITVFRKLNQWKGEGELGAWIRRIVVNTSLNGVKAKHKMTEVNSELTAEDLPDYATGFLFHEGKELLELTHHLPPGYRMVFNLHVIEGFSHEEIAVMLGVKSGTSRSQFLRARKLLIGKLTGNDKKLSSQNG